MGAPKREEALPVPVVAWLEKLNKLPDFCDLASSAFSFFWPAASVTVDEKSPPLSCSFP